jgi:aromatic-L-amino-acid decarboxylase
LLERINAPGAFFLTHTVLGGRYTIRLALGHLSTTETLLRELWDLVTRSAREVSAAEEVR